MPLLSRTQAWSIGAAVAAALAWQLPVLAGQHATTAEADIKAAFLFNFTKFVEWPARASSGAFQICTLADPAFDAVLARILVGESTSGRAIVRATPETPDFAQGCHILFIGSGEGPHIDRWVAAVRGQPVLVVGESKAAEDAGAQITFIIEDNRVRFDVNEDAASRAGLKVSSQLLRVARRVTPRTDQ